MSNSNVLPFPAVEKEEYDPELYWTDRTKYLLRKIRQNEPDYSPFTIKQLYNKAWKMGLLHE